MGRKIEQLKLSIEGMRSEKSAGGRTFGEIAADSARETKEDSPAAVLVNTTLAMNWAWSLAEPRLAQFKSRYPNVQSLYDLNRLLGSMGELEFCQKVLGILGAKPGNPRYAMLRSLVGRFLDYMKANAIVDDWEAIVKWGQQVNLDDLENDPVVKGIRGVGPATVQNIKLMSGFDTLKPDRRVLNALRHLKLANPVDIAELLSEVAGYSCIELDQLFWYWDGRNEKDS